jgi:hypothetical protein
MPVILATQEAEIRRILVQGQLRGKKNQSKTLSKKYPTKKRLTEWLKW